MESEHLRIRRFVKEDLNGFMELIRDKMTSEYAAFDEQYPTDSVSFLRVPMN